jgi:hypothetical protein
MELTYERYLHDEGLREELERRAHRERAEHLHRFLAESAEALLGRRTGAPRLQSDACG